MPSWSRSAYSVGRPLPSSPLKPCVTNSVVSPGIWRLPYTTPANAATPKMSAKRTGPESRPKREAVESRPSPPRRGMRASSEDIADEPGASPRPRAAKSDSGVTGGNSFFSRGGWVRAIRRLF